MSSGRLPLVRPCPRPAATMTAVAPSPLPFTASASHRSFHNSPRGRQNGVAGSSVSVRNSFSGKAVNGVSKLGASTSSTALDAYGDGIKALLADPIQFEPYAKKVTTDETKYKPINAVESMEGGEQGPAGVSCVTIHSAARAHPPLIACQTVLLIRHHHIT